MPDQLFLQILNMSFTASIVILFVLLARLLLKKMPKIFTLALWMVVLFRLICPISFESILSLLPTKINPIPSEIVYSTTPAIDTGILAINQAVNTSLPLPTLGHSVNPLQIWLFLASRIWLMGIVILLIYSLISLSKLQKQLRPALPDGDNVYLVEHLETPFVLGIFRPKIYLPATLSPAEKPYILLHEQTHIRHFDHLIKLLAFFVLCLHWFNPLVWLAFFLSSRDMEMVCDEAVIRQLGHQVKRDYSTSLLNLATGKPILNGTPLAFGEGDTKSRIQNLLNYKKPNYWVTFLLVIAVMAVAFTLIANPIDQPASLSWVQGLEVEEIATIELVVMPSPDEERYHLFLPSDFGDVLAFIQKNHGNYLPNPEPITGESAMLYLTLKDGTIHHVGNIGNRYLIIDGDTYQTEANWLASWPYTKGSATLPPNFDFDTRPLLTMEALYELIERGIQLSWADFAQYQSQDVGSGLLILAYPIKDQAYQLLIGGSGSNQPPLYLRLTETDRDRCLDIAHAGLDDLTAFLDTQRQLDLRPMLMVDGNLYLETHRSISSKIDEATVRWQISSTVAQSQKPSQNGQSNFGAIGALYTTFGEDLAVQLNGQWFLFEKETPSKAENLFSATIIEHVDGQDLTQVQVTDEATINQLRSLLLIGELTKRESVNDSPNEASYLQIIFQAQEEIFYYYLYEKEGKHYLEQPYNSILEVSPDTKNAILALVTHPPGTQNISPDEPLMPEEN